MLKQPKTHTAKHKAHSPPAHRFTPRTWLVLMLAVCTLPTALNLLGVDFSSNSSPITPTKALKGNEQLPYLFDALKGSLHHALLEWSAVSIALLATIASFVHYNIRRNITVPIIGTALLCAGFIDAFHTLAATRIIESQSSNTDFIPFTWAISRIFNATIMLIGGLISLWIMRSHSENSEAINSPNRAPRTLACIVLGFLTLAFTTVYFTSVSEQLPQTSYPNALISRPFDILPLALFILSGATFWAWHQQQRTLVTLALLLSILPELTTQLHMAFGSTELFDNHFNIAHSLKIVAYGSIFIGILTDLGKHAKGAEGASTPQPQKSIHKLSRQLANSRATRPLGVQLPLYAFALSLLVSLVVGGSFYIESEQLLTAQELDDLEHEGQLVEPLLATLYEQSYSEVSFLSHIPPINGIANAIINDDQNNLELWRDRLQQIFRETLKAKGIYHQIRYIGMADGARELVSVERKRNGITEQSKSRLKQHNYASYMRETLILNPGDVHFSKIELNRDEGVINKPNVPVLRVATPIFNPNNGKPFGIIMIDVDFGQFIKSLKSGALKNVSFYLANQEGDYIAHPDESKTFGFDLGERHLIQDEFIGLTNNMQRSQTLQLIQASEAHTSRASYYTNISLKTYGDVRPLRLLLQYHNDIHQQQVIALRNRSLILALSLSILALALSVVASRRLIHPLTEMTESLEDYENTGRLQQLPIDSRDEIGVLARSFHNLFVQIEDKSQELQHSVTLAEDTSANIQTILNSVIDAILTIDSNGTILTFNKAAEKIFQYSESEVLGNPVTMLMNTHYGQGHDGYMSRYLDGGQAKIIGTSRELPAMRKNGEEFPMQLSISEIHRKGERIFTGVIRDITQQKQLEVEREQALKEAQESAKLKAEFLASMSHEIRTPMNGVLGMLGLLLREQLSDKQRHYADIARSSADSLLSLINDILDFSKIEAGKMDLEVLDFDIRSQFGELAEAMAVRAQDKGIELILDLSLIDHPMVKGDPGRIRQIFTNLIGNAIKFTEQGEIILSAQLINIEPNRLQLQCTVSDTGIGIPEEKLGELFNSFTQVDASTTRKYGGSGLGLAIVNQLSQLMKGQVSVTSELGKGSCFSVQLELESSEQTGFARPHVDIHNCPILIVDDNATNLEVLRGQLEAWGAQVTEANSGAETLKILEKNIHSPFKIAILDMQMPNMDGATLAKKIREDQRWDSTQMIMMTSMSERGDAQYFADLGFAAYFPKPATTSDLFDALAIVLDNGEALEQAQPLLTRHHIHSIRDQESPLKGRILLAEDNTINQEVALGVLDDIGLSADVAANGLEVLEALRLAPTSAPYDLILMDCQMPEMDGYETTKAIRNGAAGPDRTELTIIAMTANAMKGDKEKCIASGMNDYLSKPIDAYALETMLHHHLSSEMGQPENNATAAQKQEQEQEQEQETPVWDKASALKRVRDREDRLLKLVQMFTADMPARIELLVQALEQEDYETAAELAHTIKGVAGNLSAEQLVQQCKALEQACREKDCTDFPQLQQDIQNDFQQLTAHLNNFRESLES